MRLEREILTGKEAVVLSWKNILTSVLCILVLSGFNRRLNAQDSVRSDRFYRSAQLVDRSSFPERLANADGSVQQNAGTATARRPQTSSEIWSTFLFGSLQPRTSVPKFVFSRKTPSNGNNAPSLNSRASDVADKNSSRSVYSPTTENERLAAMQRAGETFTAPNNNVATSVEEGRRVPSNSNESYVADDRVVRRTSDDSGAEDRRRRIVELNAALDARARGEQLASYPVGTLSADSKEDALSAERSKIRQTSGIERRNKQLDVRREESAVETEVLPVRPQALRISPRVFVSTEVVRLPQAGALVEEESAEVEAEEDALVKAALQKEQTSEDESVKEDVVYDIPTFDSQSERDEQVEAVAPTPLPISPLPPKSETRSSESRVLRSKASFIDPRSI